MEALCVPENGKCSVCVWGGHRDTTTAPKHSLAADNGEDPTTGTTSGGAELDSVDVLIEREKVGSARPAGKGGDRQRERGGGERGGRERERKSDGQRKCISSSDAISSLPRKIR